MQPVGRDDGAAAPGEIDDLERLSPDDQATRREAELLADAIAQQQLRASRMPSSKPGVCTNCGEQCIPTAVFCDADCREDHELRTRRAERRGQP